MNRAVFLFEAAERQAKPKQETQGNPGTVRPFTWKKN
jgi:hypothetical protein